MDDFTPAAAPGEHSLVFKRRMLLLLVGVCIAASCVLLSGAGMELKDIKATKDDQRQQITKEQQTDWQLEGQALARIYASRAANDYDWCIATSKQKKNNKDASGLLFVKIYKCASSTGSGITLSIAHNVGKRLNNSFQLILLFVKRLHDIIKLNTLTFPREITIHPFCGRFFVILPNGL